MEYSPGEQQQAKTKARIHYEEERPKAKPYKEFIGVLRGKVRQILIQNRIEVNCDDKSLAQCGIGQEFLYDTIVPATLSQVGFPNETGKSMDAAKYRGFEAPAVTIDVNKMTPKAFFDLLAKEERELIK